MFLSFHFRKTFDPGVLLSVNTLIAISFRDVGSFTATWAFIATWENMVPYTLSSTVSFDTYTEI